ncbi:hypothetical protein J2W30_005419 [Variovorax boronicumulans]|uniref:hypothetical protein n=1 Tax=Variovorax boronicumulans TaxID=436515 RepID=UPI002782E767|nr:hypothetical protein [Variovorax boronicumulans]MDQ0037642.1 hypothetical protein [Variovorax boronicumulans]
MLPKTTAHRTGNLLRISPYAAFEPTDLRSPDFPPGDGLLIQQATWWEGPPMLALKGALLRQPTELSTEKTNKSSN